MKIGLMSLNDFLIVEPYKQGQGLKAEVKNGFAFVKQKMELVPLKLLVEAKLTDGSYIPAGSSIYVQEEYLTTHEWAKKVKKAESALGSQEFIIVELKYISMIDTHEQV